ncbi:hypothetical protein BMJ22_05235, partial [Sinorhizobium medicae]
MAWSGRESTESLLRACHMHRFISLQRQFRLHFGQCEPTTGFPACSPRRGSFCRRTSLRSYFSERSCTPPGTRS